MKNNTAWYGVRNMGGVNKNWLGQDDVYGKNIGLNGEMGIIFFGTKRKFSTHIF